MELEIKLKVEVAELASKGVWEAYCKANGLDPAAYQPSDEVALSNEEAVKYGFSGGDDWR